MARKRTYLHNRFDGGMTHNNRDTSDLTKASLISHLDIYRENSRAFVMPGYVADNGYDGDPNGLKTYDIRNFNAGVVSGYVYALGTRSDGTGSKIFERDITESEWRVPTLISNYATEGTANLIDHPFMWYENPDIYYPVKNGASTAIAKHGPNATSDYEATWQNWLTAFQPSGATGYTHDVLGFNGTTYLVKSQGSGLSSITDSAVTVDAKTTSITPRAAASGDYTIGIAGTVSRPRQSKVLLWDAASLLADQNVQLGPESVFAIGFPNNAYCTVASPALDDLESNGRAFMTVRALIGESAKVLYRIDAPTDTNFRIYDLNDYYLNAMLWYGRIPTNTDGTTFREGIWALGSGSASSQFGVSLLMDTTSLGLVERAKVFGFATYFAHNEDGSVSRLDDFQTGSYDVAATIETLFYGSDTPFMKQLEGVSVTTEDLPSGGSVEVQYRFDENDSWVSLGTSSTVGKEVHNFTSASGVPIGKFKEIQFKLILTGKITLKNYLVVTTELDDLPFNV